MKFVGEGLVDFIQGQLLSWFFALFAKDYLLHSLLLVCSILAAVNGRQVVKV